MLKPHEKNMLKIFDLKRYIRHNCFMVGLHKIYKKNRFSRVDGISLGLFHGRKQITSIINLIGVFLFSATDPIVQYFQGFQSLVKNTTSRVFCFMEQ